MFTANELGQLSYLARVEVIDRNSNADAPEPRYDLGCLFDRLGTMIVGRNPYDAAGPSCANNGCTSLSQRCCDATPRTTSRSRDNGNTASQSVAIWRPPRRMGS